MPFIEPVLRNVEPFVDKMFVTISEKSNDGTRDVLANLQSELKGKLVVFTENVIFPAELTKVRQDQLDKTPMGAWVLFLDADDWWPKDQLQLADMYLGGDIDGLAVNPFQIFNSELYDSSWNKKWFTKFFKKSENTHYSRPWPRDLIFNGTEMLYWKTNPRVPRVPLKFFHLSHLMKWRFRDEKWAKEFAVQTGTLVPFEKAWQNDIDTIYKYIK